MFKLRVPFSFKFSAITTNFLYFGRELPISIKL